MSSSAEMQNALNGPKRRLRIAWIGVVREGGGVPGMGRELLEGILKTGVEVDFFTQESCECLDEREGDYPNLHIFVKPSWFRWNRWYSRGKFASFLFSTVARAQAARKISEVVIERHRERRYDCIFQLSQTELFALGRRMNALPPVVIYPCVHAAGELRWHRLESQYARQSERTSIHFVTRLFLMFRAGVQRRDLRRAAMVVGMSRRFNELIVQDYGILPERTEVLYHPISQAHDASSPSVSEALPLKLLYISRISVRKGVEMIVELSRRLKDLKGLVALEVIGDRTLWSDYTSHLKQLNPTVASYVGQLGNREVRQRLTAAAGLLLPSHYEPGGLVVGEALSAGVPVVVSDEVGSGEPVDSEVCRRFPAGDIDAIEFAVRTLVQDVLRDREHLRVVAKTQANKHFSPDEVARKLVGILHAIVHPSPSRTSGQRPMSDTIPGAGG
jgi:glycosyltransferase involved in cell wall biosynthesis